MSVGVVMSTSYTAQSHYELADPQFTSSGLGSYQGLHALVPVLIGLSIPLTLFTLIQPDALQDARFIVVAILLLIAVSAGTLFIVTLLSPGVTLALKADGARRVVDVIRSGNFAHTVYTVPFTRITSIRIETTYDDDGYAYRRAVMALQPREVIELPSSTTERDVAVRRGTAALVLA